MVKFPMVRGDNPGALLATMLEGIETEIGKVGCLDMIINSKNTTHGSFSQSLISLNLKSE
jgi:hypothetical protein